MDGTECPSPPKRIKPPDIDWTICSLKDTSYSAMPFAQRDLVPSQLDTYSWALRHPAFSEWMSSSSTSGFFWLHRKPGAGKSAIIEGLTRLARDQEAAPVMYFFFSKPSPYDKRDVPAATAGLGTQASQHDDELASLLRHRGRVSGPRDDPVPVEGHQQEVERFRDKLTPSPLAIKTYGTSRSSFQSETNAFEGLAPACRQPGVSFAAMDPSGSVLLDSERAPLPLAQQLKQPPLVDEASCRGRLAEYTIYRFEKSPKPDHGYDADGDKVKPTWEIALKQILNNTPSKIDLDVDQSLNKTSLPTLDKKKSLDEKLAMVSSFFRWMATSPGSGLVTSTLCSLSDMQPSFDLAWHALLPPPTAMSSKLALAAGNLRRLLDGGITDSKCINSLLEDPG